MNKDNDESNTKEDEINEPFSGSMDSLEYKKEKKIYNICIIFLPILISIFILSIIIYFILKEPTNYNNKKTNRNINNSNLTNYTIIEKITIHKNDSKAIFLFNSHSTKLIENIISIKIDNKTVDKIDNYYIFNFMGNYSVEITFNKKLNSMSEMFSYCSYIEELDLSNVDTSEVISMKSAFAGCQSLKKVNLENFNTSLVTDMSYMFKDCESLTSLDLYNFDTSLVTDMSYMFQNSKRLEYLNISSFNTENVYKMEYMFNLCNVSSLDLSNFNTYKVINIQYMFSQCSSLTSLNLSNFNTKEVVDFSGLFKGCKNLGYIDISDFYTNKMNFCNEMFSGLPENGTIRINMEKTWALILNQIPDDWGVIKD